MKAIDDFDVLLIHWSEEEIFTKSLEHEVNPHKESIEVTQSSSNKSNQKLLRSQETRGFTEHNSS